MEQHQGQSMIVRKPRPSQYTVLPFQIFQVQMSAGALGILCYLLSKPDHWSVSVVHLRTHFSCGKDFIYERLSELEAMRFVRKSQKRLESGRMSEMNYEVFDEPLPENPDAAPLPEKPLTVNPPLVNIEEEVTIDRVKAVPAEVVESPALDLPDGLDPEAWNIWARYRRSIKKPYKPAYVPQAMAHMASLGERQAEAVDFSIRQGYQGLFLPRTSPGGSGSSKSKTRIALEELEGFINGKRQSAGMVRDSDRPRLAAPEAGGVRGGPSSGDDGVDCRDVDRNPLGW